MWVALKKIFTCYHNDTIKHQPKITTKAPGMTSTFVMCMISARHLKDDEKYDIMEKVAASQMSWKEAMKKFKQPVSNSV